MRGTIGGTEMNQDPQTRPQAGQAQQAALQAGLGQAAALQKQGSLGELIDRLRKQNQELNELILGQRDASVKVTGENPVVEQEGSDAPVPQGDMAELNGAIVYNNELISKLRCLTTHWQSL